MLLPSSPFPSQQIAPLIVHPSLASHTQPLFPGTKSFSFTSHQRAELIQSSLTNDHVLAVMPTGGGKSLAFFAVPLLSPFGLFIVVTPFVVLTEDMCQRLTIYPISGGSWASDINLFDVQLVIVPAHEAGSSHFFEWAQVNSEQIHRVFLDKAHHIIVSESYCPCFRLFRLLTCLKKPITFLTATMPPHSIPALCQSMMINPLLLHIIQAPVSRPNVGYHIIHVDESHLVEKTTEVFRSITLQPNERGVIYTTSIAFTHEIARQLSMPAYTSRILPDEQMNKEEKSCCFLAWRSGKTPWVAATICFSEDVDFSSIQYTVIVEPKEMLSFLQESGRLGRDGIASQSITIWSALPNPPPANDPDHCRKCSMTWFLQTKPRRRLTFHQFDPGVHSCASSADNILCDFYEGLSKVCGPHFFFFSRLSFLIVDRAFCSHACST
jgi:superfamily II DNA helicase RecQ